MLSSRRGDKVSLASCSVWWLDARAFPRLFTRHTYASRRGTKINFRPSVYILRVGELRYVGERPSRVRRVLEGWNGRLLFNSWRSFRAIAVFFFISRHKLCFLIFYLFDYIRVRSLCISRRVEGDLEETQQGHLDVDAFSTRIDITNPKARTRRFRHLTFLHVVAFKIEICTLQFVKCFLENQTASEVHSTVANNPVRLQGKLCFVSYLTGGFWDLWLLRLCIENKNMPVFNVSINWTREFWKISITCIDTWWKFSKSSAKLCYSDLTRIFSLSVKRPHLQLTLYSSQYVPLFNSTIKKTE